jgi:nitric oxide reductase NorD protein
MPALPEPPAALSLLLQALSARELTLQTLPPAAPDQPAVRPILNPTHLLLPVLTAPLQRAAVAHAAAHLLYSTPGQPTATLKPLGLAVVSAVEDARVEQLLTRSLPGVRAWFDAPLRAALEARGLGATALLSRLDLALHDEAHADDNHWIHKARTLYEAARREHGLEDATAFRRLAGLLANDLGQMRVRFDPRQHAVAAPYRDDHSYLWRHPADETTRPQDLQVHVPDLAPAPQDQAAPEPVTALPHPYPEWDERSGVLRSDWCTLYELRAPVAAPLPTKEQRLHLPAPWQHGPGRRLRRQWEGETLDLDAAIEAAVDRRLGRAPAGRIFQRPGPQLAALSLLLLIDCSQSTAEAGPDGRSFLQIEQDAALLLARAVQAAGGRIAVHAFCSDTRAQVRYHRLLDFGAPLDNPAETRLRALGAAWSTRLGTALRHATALLAREPATRRALLVLSDGAPSDVDVHDARYLVEDARAAVQAAARLGLPVHGLVVDPGAADYAQHIFGRRRHRVLRQAGQLPRELLALHAQFQGA